MKKFLAIFTGTLLGSLVGSALVLFLTPFSGLEMRTKISEVIGNLRTEIINASREKRLEMENQLAQLRSGK